MNFIYVYFSDVFVYAIIVDCRNNGKIQEFYHPGLFVNSKWTCCDHKSKHSYGCTRSFISIEQSDTNVMPPMGGSAVGGGSRKPLPPTPMDNVQHSNNFSGPNMGMGGGGGMGRAPNHVGGGGGPPKNSQYFGHVPENLKKGNNHISSYSHHNPGMEPSQPPAPVSRLIIYMYVSVTVPHYICRYISPRPLIPRVRNSK